MNTDGIESVLARQAMLTPEEKQRVLEAEEKRLFGPYPATNRHERRAALRLTSGSPRVARVADVKFIRGTLAEDGDTYTRLKVARKQYRPILLDKRYRVATLTLDGAGQFEAKIVEVV